LKIKQVSVFLENKVGHLRMIAEELKAAGLNIRAISLADSKDFGVLRMIVQDPDKACSVLRAANHAVKETDVIAVEVLDRPGGLADLLKALEGSDVNIEYMYAVLEKRSENAVIILKVEDIDGVIAEMQKLNIKLLSGDEVYGAL
jgi:hypothetical protein